MIDRKSNIHRECNKSSVLIKILYHWLEVNVMFRICYIILSTNMEWKDYSLLHTLYIQGKKEKIYNTDLVLPEFFLDQEKAISQLANTMFRKVIHDLKKLKKAMFKWREMCEQVVKQWTRGKRDWKLRG